MRRNLLTVFILVAGLACKGADGATGPQGAQGPQGAAGPPGPQGAAGAVNRADATGVFNSSGSFTGLLPAGATAGGRVPVIACYTSSDGRTWLAVAQVPPSSTGTFCGLSGIGTSTPGITMVNGIPGWFYYIIAVW
jgi:collagen type VII alpha